MWKTRKEEYPLFAVSLMPDRQEDSVMSNHEDSPRYRERGFLFLRGGLALIFLIILIVIYVYELIESAVTGARIPAKEHLAFWSVIIISGILTAIGMVGRKS